MGRGGPPIIVTGGAGFIGSSFVRLMVAQGVPVVVLDALTYAGNLANLSEVKDAPGYTFVHGNIGDAPLVADLLARHRPRAIVSIAAETHVDRSIDGPAVFIQTNVVGVSTLLETARQYWRNLPAAERDAFRFVQVSTDEVYGSVEQGSSREGDPYQPNSPYSASKAAGDHMARAYFRTYGMPTLVTNGANTYGPRQFPEKLIPLQILNALDGRPLPVYGNGNNLRDWLYVDDHCRGIAAVLAEGRPGENYNIGSGTDDLYANIQVVHNLCDLLDEMAPKAGMSYLNSIAFVDDRPGHDFRYALNCGKLMQDTNWRPLTNFTDGLRATLRWYLDNDAWFRSATQARYDRQRLGMST